MDVGCSMFGVGCFRSSGRRCEAHHKIEAGGEFADTRAFNRREIHRDCGARFRIFDVHVDAVLFVLRLAFDVALRRPLVASLHFDGVMNVPRALRIQCGFDRAEIIFAGRAGQEAAKALEIRVALRVRVFGVQINSVVVHLPDFHKRVANRIAFGVQDPSAQVRDLAHRGRDAVVDNDEVVVGVERQFVGIERSFGLFRRDEEFLGERAGNGKQRGAQAQAAQESAAVLIQVNLMVEVDGVHGFFFVLVEV